MESKIPSFSKILRRVSPVGIVSLCTFLSFQSISAQENSVGGVAGAAAREVVKRQNQVTAAQTLFAAGSQALADRSYGEAMDNFKAAFETMPPVPAVEAQRRAFFKRYQSAALAFTEVKISEARWAEATQTLEEVLTTADDNQMPDSLVDPRVTSMLKDLANREGRFNQALSPQHLARVNEVESNLILANGYLELGDYDRAERTYHKVINIDKTNQAARRGLERVEQYRMNYYDAARDHTRAKMTREIEELWESKVPPVITSGGNLGGDTIPQAQNLGSVAIEQKLNSIRIPQIELIDASLKEVIEFLVQKSQELDTTATDPASRGVNIVIDAGASAAGDDPGSRIVSMRLTDVPLSAALKYATQQARLKYRVDNFAVTIVPLSDANSLELITRTYPVPPGFISAGGPDGGAGGAAVADPFANPEPTSGIAIKRVTAKDFLESSGVVFGEGASARFIAKSSKLVVRNTPEQLLAIENLIQAARENGGKMAEIRVRLVSVSELALNQIGMDWLLGGSNLGGGTPRIFAGGGTDGNTINPPIGADFPFANPGGGPIGLNPITSGLRIGDIPDGTTIDELLQFGVAQNVSTRAPGIFSISGVFTDPQFQAVLRAVSQLKGTDFMDQSYVVAKPGQRAAIERIREFIYPTEYDAPQLPTNLGGNNQGFVPVTPSTPTAFEMRRVGTVIEVEPTVGADNKTINLLVNVDFTDFAGFIDYGTPITNPLATIAAIINPFAPPIPAIQSTNFILMPIFDSVKESTNVVIWDGQTIVIGGFHGEQVDMIRDKVPGIGDLPIVGSAFKTKTDRSSKRAILIFVTVNLVDPSGMPLNAPGEDPDLSYRNDPLPPRPGIGGGGVAPVALPAATFPNK